MIGSRLREAREKRGAAFSRKVIVDLLNAHPKAPSFKARKVLQEGTYKKWETAENAIQLEWIPAICDVLDCDIGYLFGEYEERRRETSDVCKVTGLSEAVIERFRREEGTCRKKQFEDFLLNDKFWEIINCFHKWRDVSKGILEEKRKQSDMFMEIVKSGQYPEDSELFWRASNILDESVRSYEIDKYYCSRLFDEIRDTFLPNVKV